ncbi:MAG TPA: sigma 54-interacting transcriptional regulator [Chitinophagaceae bacterium]|nr:sigma 54-interacting transcriptional regulator [Chitinophagaceae bacterium]
MSTNGVMKRVQSENKFFRPGKKAPAWPRLTEYLASTNCVPGFPSVLLADHVPCKEEFAHLVADDLLSGQAKRPFIIALHNADPGSMDDCWSLLGHGISDIIQWEEEDELIDFLKSFYLRHQSLLEILGSPLVKDNLIGESSRWTRFLSEVIEATMFSQASLLLIGQSGTGKELLSRLIHTLDKREDKKKLIIVDCTTIVPELSGSELFGHERGSYTNAVSSREGAVALANGGTLFLDEIGELPLNLQAELLRVLQEGTYKKVGSNAWQKTSFRLVCATNKDLRSLIAEGKFRQDLYFRVADCEFAVPSLDQRKEDIPLLVHTFLGKLFTVEQCPKVDKLVMDYLVRRDYPGNVRELKQLVQRIALKHVSHNKITIGEVPVNDRALLNAADRPTDEPDSIKVLIRHALQAGEDWWNLKTRISETAIQVALDLEGNNKQKAAERLGVDVRTVQQYVRRKG